MTPVSVDGLKDKDVVHMSIYSMEYDWATRKTEIFPFAITWGKLECHERTCVPFISCIPQHFALRISDTYKVLKKYLWTNQRIIEYLSYNSNPGLIIHPVSFSTMSYSLWRQGWLWLSFVSSTSPNTSLCLKYAINTHLLNKVTFWISCHKFLGTGMTNKNSMWVSVVTEPIHTIPSS